MRIMAPAAARWEGQICAQLATHVTTDDGTAAAADSDAAAVYENSRHIFGKLGRSCIRESGLYWATNAERRASYAASHSAQSQTEHTCAGEGAAMKAICAVHETL